MGDRLEEEDAHEEEWRTSTYGGDPWMSQTQVCPDVVNVSGQVMSTPLDLADGERETGSGGVPTDVAREPSLASPRLIPAASSPPFSVQLPPDLSMGDMRAAPASFDRKCVPSQVPTTDVANYDQLSCVELHVPCKQ